MASGGCLRLLTHWPVGFPVGEWPKNTTVVSKLWPFRRRKRKSMSFTRSSATHQARLGVALHLPHRVLIPCQRRYRASNDFFSRWLEP